MSNKIRQAIYFRYLRIAFILSLLTLFSAKSSMAEFYAIDPEHSRIEFKVKHMGIGWVTGEFNEYSGKFAFNSKDIKQSSVEAVIKPRSINTNTSKRDQHLKSPVFLDTMVFKAIRFISNDVEAGSGPDNFKVKGVLTIKDVSKEVILDVQHSGSLVDPWGVPRAAFRATTVINRKDFKLTWNRILETGQLLVGEDIYVTLDIQGVEVKDSRPKLVDPSSPFKKD